MPTAFYSNVISSVKSIIDKEFGIIDENGVVIACSEEGRIGDFFEFIRKFANSNEQNLVVRGNTFQKIFIRNKLDCIIYFAATDVCYTKYLSLIAMNIINCKPNYDEKYDKVSFIKSIIMDNILPGEFLLKAKELHLSNNVTRCVLLIQMEKSQDMHAHEVVQKLFPNSARDFVVILDDENTVLVKELKSGDALEEINKTAEMIVDSVTSETMTKTTVGIGSIVNNIKDIGKSYKEAKIALLVGGIFENNKFIANYNRLGIGRLIYQLPTTLCKLFLNEVFKEGAFESLDDETILTIQKFFENSLNVSETSRQLYVHRNTLVYRLEKIQKITGLDLRNFDDAIIFNVAMLVKKYLEKSEQIR